MNTQTASTIDDQEQYFELKITLPKNRQTITYRLISACVIGSDEHSDLVLSDPAVAAQHARLFVSDSFDVFIEPVGDAVVALNGAVVENPVCVKDGDWIVLGNTPYQIAIDSSRIIRSTQSDDQNADFDLKGKSPVSILDVPLNATS